MSAATKPTRKKRVNFLSNLAKHGNVSAAALASGMGRSSWYDLKNQDADFSALWDEAVEVATDLLILEAKRRAYKGTKRPVFHQGVQCGVIREYSDTLLMFLIKAKRSEFRDNKTVDVNLRKHENSIDELE